MVNLFVNNSSVINLIYLCQAFYYTTVVVTGDYASICGKTFSNIQLLNVGSVKANGGEPKSCFGQVFNFKLGCFCCECNWAA
jgi:hypothetical protein